MELAAGHLALGVLNLNERRRAVRHGLVEQVERVLVRVAREGSADHGEEALERTESVDDGWSLIAATDHAVGALGIARGHAVVFPFGFFKKLLVGVGVAFLEQVAGPLPTEDVVGGHAPGNAIVISIAHGNSRNRGDMLNFQVFLRFERMARKRRRTRARPMNLV